MHTLLKSMLVIARQPASYLQAFLTSIECMVICVEWTVVAEWPLVDSRHLHLGREIGVAATQHQYLLVRSCTSTPDERLELPPLAIPLESFLPALLKEAIPELD